MYIHSTYVYIYIGSCYIIHVDAQCVNLYLFVVSRLSIATHFPPHAHEIWPCVRYSFNVQLCNVSDTVRKYDKCCCEILYNITLDVLRVEVHARACRTHTYTGIIDLSIYLSIYLYIYMRTHTHTCIYIYIYNIIYIYIRTHARTCVCVHTTGHRGRAYRCLVKDPRPSKPQTCQRHLHPPPALTRPSNDDHPFRCQPAGHDSVGACSTSATSCHHGAFGCWALVPATLDVGQFKFQPRPSRQLSTLRLKLLLPMDPPPLTLVALQGRTADCRAAGHDKHEARVW